MGRAIYEVDGSWDWSEGFVLRSMCGGGGCGSFLTGNFVSRSLSGLGAGTGDTVRGG